MKNTVLALIALMAMIMVFGSAQSSAQNAGEARVQALEKRVQQLESQVAEIKERIETKGRLAK
jgi:uncharacterized protein YceH (UPF0502 family)